MVQFSLRCESAHRHAHHAHHTHLLSAIHATPPLYQASTVCSASLTSLGQEQSKRYREKGYGLAVSAVIWYIYFVHFPSAMKSVWPWVLEQASEFTLYWAGTAILLEIVFVSINLIMGLIYMMELDFFERYRIQRQKPWQWNSTNPAVVKRWRELRWSAVKTIAFNHIVLGPAMGYFGYQGAVDWGLHMGVDTFPSWLTSMWQITLFMVIDDTMFYWGHRLLHHKRIYKHIHKLHHSFYQPVGVASLYSHPIEVILTNTIPFMTGPILVGAHMSTTWMWLILRICETVDGHCGYDFSWSPYRLLPFSGDSAHHDFHHSHNKGNFGSFFTWWDKIGGTDKPFEEWAATNPYAQPPPPFFVEWVQTNVFGMAVRSAKKSAVRI